jgi:hypothetical protein
MAEDTPQPGGTGRPLAARLRDYAGQLARTFATSAVAPLGVEAPVILTLAAEVLEGVEDLAEAPALICALCFYVGAAKHGPDAVTVIRGFAVCEDHAGIAAQGQVWAAMLGAARTMADHDADPEPAPPGAFVPGRP